MTSARNRIACAVLLVVACAPGVRAAAQTAAPVTYAVTFPEPEHHWMQVEVTFPGVGTTPLRVHMSRSSPGRYAVHEFAKNVFSVAAFDGASRPLSLEHPTPDEWDIAGHDGTVRVVYKIFGDQTDGTYLGIDTTHAHVNMPAAFMWAEGLDLRPIRIAFTPPPLSGWTVGSQLFRTNDPLVLSAPNLQYFMDSPTELTRFVTTTFTVPNAGGGTATFRLMAHGGGTQSDLDALARAVERLVREEMAVYGEFPAYEPGEYTFLLEFVSWGRGDGMEHRNSTSITLPGVALSTAAGRAEALDTIAHEFFHNWNVERIRPAGIEPFDLTRENVTCCLWLAEGFTQYYGPLSLLRARLTSTPGDMLSAVSELVAAPGRQVRSAVGMSEQAPFADLGMSIDPDDRSRTFLSYYTYGEAVALGLDLTLREMSGGRVSLDDYMRKLWMDFGKPADPRPGYVARPYTLADLRADLASVTGNRAFADQFFDKYIEGREVVDYAHLLSLAGYQVRPLSANQGWFGGVRVEDTGAGLSIGTDRSGDYTLVPFGTPIYEAGVDAGDVITAIDGQPATTTLWAALARRAPGSVVALTIRRRDGKTATTSMTLRPDPRVTVVPIESTGAALSAAQRAFRDSWFGTRAP